jgi:hypothetical protein
MRQVPAMITKDALSGRNGCLAVISASGGQGGLSEPVVAGSA